MKKTSVSNGKAKKQRPALKRFSGTINMVTGEMKPKKRRMRYRACCNITLMKAFMHSLKTVSDPKAGTARCTTDAGFTMMGRNYEGDTTGYQVFVTVIPFSRKLLEDAAFTGGLMYGMRP